MKGILFTIVLAGFAVLSFTLIGRALVEFAKHDPHQELSPVIIAVVACVTALGILLGVVRVRDTAHRVALAGIVPVGVVLATALMITGIGVLLLDFAHMKHEIITVKEPLAVLVALIVSSLILGGAALLARRRVDVQA
ncbi:MAG: hypothetical protein BZY82_00780 [SAR202 cluster bacterium Io17-Chloro-G3]|nr:MAG: hypothetical protein BZY82_00780 [SAR202 cluster bacterium Io17-Chloro-G3]